VSAVRNRKHLLALLSTSPGAFVTSPGAFVHISCQFAHLSFFVDFFAPSFSNLQRQCCMVAASLPCSRLLGIAALKRIRVLS
jgi:hypothetical protein